MGSRSSTLLWIAVFGLSLLVSMTMLCELRGVALLTGRYASLVDKGPVSRLILVVFGVSLAINARNSLMLFREIKRVRHGLRSDPSSSRLKLIGEGLLGEHAARMHQIYGHEFDGEVSQFVSLGVARSRLYGAEWLVRTCSQLLLTLGLIGTVLGLANSLGGLSHTMRSLVVNDDSAVSTQASSHNLEQAQRGRDELQDGLDVAVGGMASAFSTTLVGAILGGVLLKLLSNCTQYLADDLIDEIEIISETELVPLLRATSGAVTARRREMLAFMDSALERETARLTKVSESIEDIATKFDGLAKSVARTVG